MTNSRSRLGTYFLLMFAVSYPLSRGQLVRPQTSGSPTQSAPGEHVAQRVIHVPRGNLYYPLGTFSVFYDGKPVKSGVPFDAPDDWLKHISLSFENRSNYPLVAGSFQLDFRELGGDPILFYDLRFGVLPEHQLYTPSGRQVPRPSNETPVSVASKGVALIPFEAHYSELRSAIETRGSLAQVKSCWISYGLYYFGDDLRWGLGSFARANPSVPGQYVPAALEDFMPTPANGR